MSDNSKWRLLLGLGAVPGFCVVIGSYIESKYAPKKTSVNSSEKDPSVSMWDALTDPKNQKKLIATGGGWYLFDVAYYGVSLFAGEILGEIGI